MSISTRGWVRKYIRFGDFGHTDKTCHPWHALCSTCILAEAVRIGVESPVSAYGGNDANVGPKFDICAYGMNGLPGE